MGTVMAPSAAEELQEATPAPAADDEAGPSPGILESHMATRSCEDVGEMTTWEKISIVFAAFDADGDGRLCYAELDALRRAAARTDEHGGMEAELYHALCAELGADADLGLR